ELEERKGVSDEFLLADVPAAVGVDESVLSAAADSVRIPRQLLTRARRRSPRAAAPAARGTLRRPPSRPADRPHFSAPRAAAEEPIAAIRLEPRHFHARRQVELLQDLTAAGTDPPQIALAAFEGGVPQLTVDPGDAGDEAIGFDGAQNRPGLRIELMDLPVPIMPDPQRPFGPGEPRTAAGRRNRGEHTAR